MSACDLSGIGRCTTRRARDRRRRRAPRTAAPPARRSSPRTPRRWRRARRLGVDVADRDHGGRRRREPAPMEGQQVLARSARPRRGAAAQWAPERMRVGIELAEQRVHRHGPRVVLGFADLGEQFARAGWSRRDWERTAAARRRPPPAARRRSPRPARWRSRSPAGGPPPRVSDAPRLSMRRRWRRRRACRCRGRGPGR